MEDMKRLKEMLCGELKKIVQTGSITPGSLDAVNKLIVTIEKIDRIEEIEGMSQSRRYSGTNNYGSYDNGSYNNGSYGNGSYNDGSYGNTRNDSYGNNMRSRYSQAGEDMGRVIEDMMRNPSTSQTDKDVLRRAMDILNR